MKTARHNSIGCVEGLLDAVSMMAVNVDIEDARVCPKKLENTEDNIVDVTEA